MAPWHTGGRSGATTGAGTATTSFSRCEGAGVDVSCLGRAHLLARRETEGKGSAGLVPIETAGLISRK